MLPFKINKSYCSDFINEFITFNTQDMLLQKSENVRIIRYTLTLLAVLQIMLEEYFCINTFVSKFSKESHHAKL